MKRNRFIFVAIGVVLMLLAVLAVCLLPWRTKIDLEMKGSFYTADGKQLDEVSFRLTGHRLQYLLREDALDITLEFPDRKPLLIQTQVLFSIPDFGEKMGTTGRIGTYTGYSTQLQHFTGNYFQIGPQLEYVIMLTEELSDGYFLIATPNGQGNDSEILKIAQDIYLR